MVLHTADIIVYNAIILKRPGPVCHHGFLLLCICLDTHAAQQESSLEEMQKQALYISQDVIRGRQEIAEGSYILL